MKMLVARPIELRGSIWADENGVFVSRCETLDIMSAGQTFEEAWENTIDAIRLYLQACASDGTLLPLISRLSADGFSVSPSAAKLTFDAKPLQGAQITQSLDLAAQA